MCMCKFAFKHTLYVDITLKWDLALLLKLALNHPPTSASGVDRIASLYVKLCLAPPDFMMYAAEKCKVRLLPLFIFSL